jgi:hypothetical protein
MKAFWLLAVLLAFQTGTAYALNRCVQEDGTVTYSDKDCVTVAPGSYAKPIQQIKKDPRADANSCAAVRELAEEVTKMMIKGLSVSEVYTTFGGRPHVGPITANIVAYVYEHESKISDINPVKMGAVSFARCNHGEFGNLKQASSQ